MLHGHLGCCSKLPFAGSISHHLAGVTGLGFEGSNLVSLMSRAWGLGEKSRS